jgi:hypothetical protein
MNSKDLVPSNMNALYSAGVGRFFAVSGLDQFTTFEVAGILSSKMPGIVVFSMQSQTPPFFSDNCIEYGLVDKNIFKNSYEKQLPIFKSLSLDNIIKLGEMPVDFNPNANSQNWQVFSKFRDYTHYVIRAWFAAKMCDMVFNSFPMKNYSTNFVDCLPEDVFDIKADASMGNTKVGITNEIKSILYFSNSEKEAVDSMEKMWEKNNTVYTNAWRRNFYEISGSYNNIRPLKLDLSSYAGWIM